MYNHMSHRHAMAHRTTDLSLRIINRSETGEAWSLQYASSNVEFSHTSAVPALIHERKADASEIIIGVTDSIDQTMTINVPPSIFRQMLCRDLNTQDLANKHRKDFTRLVLHSACTSVFAPRFSR